jgi:hypothetical protein
LSSAFLKPFLRFAFSASRLRIAQGLIIRAIFQNGLIDSTVAEALFSPSSIDGTLLNNDIFLAHFLYFPGILSLWDGLRHFRHLAEMNWMSSNFPP